VDQRVCGNNVLTSDEVCDDGNTVSGDGCSGDCKTIEPGWQCHVPGKPCTPICGDGKVEFGKPCDDGNTDSGDGCSSTCQVEPGSSCTGSPSVCIKSVCGNGILEAGEACDCGTDPTKLPTGCTGPNGLSTATAAAARRPAPWSRSAEERTGPGRPTPARPLAGTATSKLARTATMATWLTTTAAHPSARSKMGSPAPRRPTLTPSHARKLSTAANVWSCRSSTVTSRARRKPTVTRISSTTARSCNRLASSALPAWQASPVL